MDMNRKNSLISTLARIFTIGILSIVTACNDPEAATAKDEKQTDTLEDQPATTTSPKDTIPAVSPLQNRILDTIAKLPEVVKRQQYIEEQTKGERHLTIWISGEPNATSNYYWVNAGEDNGTNLVTHFNFWVYPDSMRILYYDTPNDTAITLEDWRRISK